MSSLITTSGSAPLSLHVALPTYRGGREGVGASPFGVYGAPLEHRWQLTAHDVPPTKLCSPTWHVVGRELPAIDRKSTRPNSSHRCISYAGFCSHKKTIP